MNLKRFNMDVAYEISSWFPTPKEACLWGGVRFGWPIQVSKIIARSELPNIEFYTLVEGCEVLGFIELQEINETEIRLCRVAVSPRYRGRGLGKKLIQLSLDEIKQRNSYKTVTLAVFTENIVAYNCYQYLGFAEVDKEPKFKVFNGEKWPLVQMEIAL